MINIGTVRIAAVLKRVSAPLLAVVTPSLLKLSF